MKRAATDKQPESIQDGDSDMPHQGPEHPSERREEEEDPPLKKAKHVMPGSSDQTLVAESSEANLGRPEGAAAQGETSDSRANLPSRDHNSRDQREEATTREARMPSTAAQGVARMAATEFPMQLMNLLQRNVAPDALWFLDGGEAIGLKRDLIGQVLEVHFRGMKFNSLVRNLNRWGFRRISHPSLTDKDRGYHHLLFQRDNPDLIHKMRRDASATDVVRQLGGLADGAPVGESTRQEAKRSPESERTQNVATQAQPPPACPTHLSDLNMEPRQTVHPSLLQGVLGTQINQGVSAQQLEWQRQRSLLALQFGALQPSNWGGLGSWSAGQNSLASAPALAFGMAQQQQHHHQQQQLQQWQTHAALAQHQAIASASASQNNPSSFPLPATTPAASSQETAQQQDEEEDSHPSKCDEKELS